MDELTQFMNMTEQEQIDHIEEILMAMWEEGEVELVGFNENNEPLFKARGD
jgi:hypothetical protein